MLSIGKLTPGRANYYIEQLPAGADEYYLDGDHHDARWLGTASAQLGLSGPVEAPAFRNLIAGRHPLTADPLGLPATTNRRVAGFDLCLSAPKSVSLLWALGAPDAAAAVTDAHDRAVAAVVETLEQEVVRARRGAGGRRMVETGGVAAAAFPHRSSRAGDPQIHTHLVVANLTPDSDGRWSSLYGTRIYRWAKTLGYLYQAELRAGLTETLGLAWQPVRNGMADIDGVADEAVRRFSSRRFEIQAVLDRIGAQSARAAQTATLATRPAKSTVADLADLRRDWLTRAADLGLDPEAVAGLLGRAVNRRLDLPAVLAELLGPSGLTANNSSFDRRHVLQALAVAEPAGPPAAELRAAADHLLNRREVVEFATSDGAGARYSTVELLEVENRMLARAQTRLPNSFRPATDETLDRAYQQRPTLTAEQRAMVAALTTADAAVQVVIGRAGTGKTFALDAARAVWEQTGRPVLGAALAARAAAELQAGSGIASTTLDRLLAELDRPGPLAGLAPHSVVVVDEAGLVGTRKLDRLLDHTLRAGGSLVLVGDHRQLPEIESGGALSALAGRVPTVELTENRRQGHAWERDALAELRHGSVPSAVDAYRNHRRINLAATAEQARQNMIDDWWAARTGGQRVGMYALRRADVDDLNQRARRHLQAEGIIGPDRLSVAGRHYADGDEVMYLRNDRRLGVRNGTVATITHIDPEAQAMTLSDGTRLPRRYLERGHLGHAYAATIHKSQGATVDRALLLGSDNLYREAGYVGLSRARDRSDLYLVAGEAAGPLENPFGELQRGLGRSQAQQLAVEQLSPSDITKRAMTPSVHPQLAALLADPPAWAVEALGPTPLHDFDRQRWAERAACIDAYRDIYAIDGPDPLGPQPDNQTQRRAWELARLAVLEQTRSLELEQGIEP